MYFSFIFWGNFFCSLFFTAPKIAFAISNYSSSTKKYSGMDILVSSILIYIDLEEDRGDIEDDCVIDLKFDDFKEVCK